MQKVMATSNKTGVSSPHTRVWGEVWLPCGYLLGMTWQLFDVTCQAWLGSRFKGAAQRQTLDYSRRSPTAYNVITKSLHPVTCIAFAEAMDNCTQKERCKICLLFCGLCLATIATTQTDQHTYTHASAAHTGLLNWRLKMGSWPHCGTSSSVTKVNFGSLSSELVICLWTCMDLISGQSLCLHLHVNWPTVKKDQEPDMTSRLGPCHTWWTELCKQALLKLQYASVLTLRSSTFAWATS